MRISKSDLLSIKDFSNLTGIKQSTLRYYDELGLFSPTHRSESGYRYYSPQQIITINSINLLHGLSMPIRQISEIQNKRTPELLYHVLSDKEETLEAELISIERSFNVVRTLKRMIQTGLLADENHIEVRFLEEMPIVVGPKNDWGDTDSFYNPFLSFCANAKQFRIDLRLPVGGLFETFDAFYEYPGKPTNFFSVDLGGLDKRPAGKYLSAFQRGYYGETGNLANRMKAYILEHGIVPIGPMYHIFLHDELSVSNPDNYLMHATIEVE